MDIHWLKVEEAFGRFGFALEENRPTEGQLNFVRGTDQIFVGVTPDETVPLAHLLQSVQTAMETGQIDEPDFVEQLRDIFTESEPSSGQNQLGD